jgi:cytochrome c biogenesis protein CcdA
VNFQENDWLAGHWQASGNMIVVARFEDGREVKTQRLDRVMELADRRPELAEYIRKGLRFEDVSRDMRMVLWAALAAAFGFGLLTAISPCPLATNIAAVSFLSRGAGRPRRVLLSGLTYTLGRTAAYVGLGVLILYVLQAPWAGGGSGSAGSISRFLQRYGGMVIGPVLILAGMLLSGLVNVSASLSLGGHGLQQRASGGGAKWAFVLGVLFALSFCPISATIFFGSMIALSTQNQSPILLPAAFGVATALPVLFFAFLIAFAGAYVGKAFHRMTQLDRWLRRATGIVFILAGVYYCLAHTYGLSLPAWG